MQQLIREILEEANISASSPPQMSYEEARQYYTEEETRQYQQYQEEMRAYEEEMQRYNEQGEAYRAYQQQMAEFQVEEERKRLEVEGLEKWEKEQAQTLQRQKEVKKAVGYNKHGIKAPPLPSRYAISKDLCLSPYVIIVARFREPVKKEVKKIPDNLVPPIPTKPIKPKLPGELSPCCIVN